MYEDGISRENVNKTKKNDKVPRRRSRVSFRMSLARDFSESLLAG